MHREQHLKHKEKTVKLSRDTNLAFGFLPKMQSPIVLTFEITHQSWTIIKNLTNSWKLILSAGHGELVAAVIGNYILT